MVEVINVDFKKLILILGITAIVIFGVLLGGTYAYYTYTDGTGLNVTTGNFDSGVAVIFNQSEYINTNTGIPITEADVSSMASKSVFTLVPDKNILAGYEASININLVDIKIADELKVSDFKYKLSCSNGSTTSELSSGTGTSIGSNDSISLGILSTSDNTFDITKTYTCTFFVWLNESGTNQNNLMNKNFSGLIKVNSAFRK